jgi:hypothetical protein
MHVIRAAHPDNRVRHITIECAFLGLVSPGSAGWGNHTGSIKAFVTLPRADPGKGWKQELAKKHFSGNARGSWMLHGLFSRQMMTSCHHQAVPQLPGGWEVAGSSVLAACVFPRSSQNYWSYKLLGIITKMQGRAHLILQVGHFHTHWKHKVVKSFLKGRLGNRYQKSSQNACHFLVIPYMDKI